MYRETCPDNIQAEDLSCESVWDLSKGLSVICQTSKGLSQSTSPSHSWLQESTLPYEDTLEWDVFPPIYGMYVKEIYQPICQHIVATDGMKL